MKKWKQINLSKYAPCGFELKHEIRIFTGGMISSILFGCLYFKRLYDTWYELWELVWEDGEMVRKGVRDGAVMRDFVELFYHPNALAGFLIVAFCMAAFMVLHYAYHYQDSKSIYVMRRLPDKWELHRRCAVLPLIGIGISLITAFLFLVLCYGVYMKVTPPECIVGDQWQKIWIAWFGL